MQGLGLALGGGGARGMAHVGVLAALDAAGMAPGHLAGTSIGALVAAVYCGGDFAAFRSWAEGLSRLDALRLADPVFPSSGLMAGAKLMDKLKSFLRERRIEDCRPALAIVAAHARTGRETVFTRGPLLDAVRASIAVPGILEPGMFEGEPMLDGALVNPVPVTPCRVLGARVVAGVDVARGLAASGRAKDTSRTDALLDGAARLVAGLGARLGPAQASAAQMLQRWIAESGEDKVSIFDSILAGFSITQATVKGVRLAQDPPEDLVSPDVGGLGFLDFHRSAEAVVAGLAAGRDLAGRLAGRRGGA